jgi:phosphatidylglycerol lysyltransferase
MSASVSPRDPARARRPLQWLVAVASVALLALALWVLHGELTHIHRADVRRAFDQVGWPAFVLALLGTAGSYLALTGYDALALRHLERPLSYARIAAASFIATAVGHNLGLAILTAGAVRMRLYTAWGLSAPDVALMAGLVTATFGIGATCAVGLALLLEPVAAASWLHLGAAAARAIGALLLSGVAVYLGFAWRRRRPLTLGSWQLQVPGVGMAGWQIALALVDLSCAALALWALLPADAAPPFAVFVGIYVVAIVAGSVSHVPGGLGVFETVLLLALPQMPRDALLAAVIGYRVVYYLLPLALAALLAAAMSLRERQARRERAPTAGPFRPGPRVVSSGVAEPDQLERAWESARPLFVWLAPAAAGTTVFVTGSLLLFSGSLPAEATRLHWLREVVPLPVLEISHLLGSLLGLGLLILAQALVRRVRLAWLLASAMLAAAAAASLLKGLDFEEAALALGVLAILWVGRSAFNREATVASDVLLPSSLAAIATVVLATAWIGLLSYRHLDYSHELWWQFAFRGDAPRFLRATLAVVVTGSALALWHTLRPAPPEPGSPTAADLDRAARIVVEAPAADAALALVGDKRLLFDDERPAFLMYQVRGRSWVAMGNPVGDTEAGERLAWRLREMADRHGGRAVFYQVDAGHLPLYLDLGLQVVKLGEEATVPLANFTLDGPARRDLRQALRRAERDGLRFEWVAAGSVPPLIESLRAVSDAWLAAKHSREKGFSLGCFEPAYLQRFPCALVRRADEIVGFANVWASGGRQELSADLMRHRPDAPPGVMDFLFTELMLWGAREGYGRFSLGMAPLAGLEAHPLAPLWHRLGTLIYRHGEHFYNFQGLRAFKEKFDPQWQPRYLAGPGGIALPSVLLDVAALIGGGWAGVVTR